MRTTSSRSSYPRYLICVVIFFSLCACTKGTDTRDPYESFNRKMFAFNDGLDKAIVKPVSKVYNKVLPNFVRLGVTNFFSNLDEIPSFASNILQGNWKDAGHSAGRFAYNTTFGIAGLFDIATRMGLEERKTDLGATFGKWGDSQSPYLVLPLLGPATIRDFSGFMFDFTLFNPFFYVDDSGVRWGGTVLWMVNRRASVLTLEKVTEEFTLDAYTLQRDAYLQYRDNRIRRAKGEEVVDTFVEGDTSDDTISSSDDKSTTSTVDKQDKKASDKQEKNHAPEKVEKKS